MESLKQFTIQILSKIEITIDFNGPGGQTLSFKYPKTGSIFFNYSYYHCLQFVL